MRAAFAFVRVLVCLPFAFVGCTSLVEADPDGPIPRPYDDNDGGSGDCTDVEADLDGVWITPEGAAPDPNASYATLELVVSNHAGTVEQYAGGANQTTPIVEWRVDGAECDQLHTNYGTGFTSEYSEILELSSTTIELQATDGSYYGQTTRYSRLGEGGADDCSAVEADLDGVWITPEGATPDPNGSYATLELDVSNHAGTVEQYAGGANQTTPIVEWKVEGAACDQLHTNYGTGFTSEYGEILELSSTALELQATDGSYYGQKTRYSRPGGGGGPTSCNQPCQVSSDCDGGLVCLPTTDGDLCSAPECEQCFAAGQNVCFSSGSCEFDRCEPESTTCGLACGDGAVTCGEGEACVDAGMGFFNCFPPECAACTPAGLLCGYIGATCEFIECTQ